MLMVVADLFRWMAFLPVLFHPRMSLRNHPKCKCAQLKGKILILSTKNMTSWNPLKYFLWAQILTTWFLQEMSVCLCGFPVKCVSDLYIAAWKDLNSCKQHCNQCPICFHVPLVWMPFRHFFHSLPSGCLRTSNPEKRAHLPKEERSKLDFWASSLTWTRQRKELQ